MSKIVHSILTGICHNCHNVPAAHTLDGKCLFDATMMLCETTEMHADCVCEELIEYHWENDKDVEAYLEDKNRVTRTGVVPRERTRPDASLAETIKKCTSGQ